MMRVFLVSQNNLAPDDPILRLIKERFTLCASPSTAEGILVLGGDGTMIDAIHEHRRPDLPFFGLNFGHEGFLMNEPEVESLMALSNDQIKLTACRLLKADMMADGQPKGSAYAFNDFYFERSTPQTARIQVEANDDFQIPALACDGILVCTPQGSQAYNRSAGGVSITMSSGLMVLTGICPAGYHQWRSTPFLPTSIVSLKALEIEKRPVRFLADGRQYEAVNEATITYSDEYVQLGFMAERSLSKRVILRALT